MDTTAESVDERSDLRFAALMIGVSVVIFLAVRRSERSTER